MMTRLRAVAVGAALCVASMAAMAQGTAAAETGSWQRHELNFRYMGFTSIYSCDGLVDKLRVLLKAAGAREDFKVVSGACSELSGRPDRFANAKLVYYTLQPAASGATESVPAQWRSVRIVDGRPLDLARGDCELVEQFRDEVLRKTFAIRKLQDKLSCTPHQVGAPYRLEYEVLAPVSPAASGTPR